MGQNTLSELFGYLQEWGMVSSIKDFGDQVRIARSIASQLISGKTPLSEKYIKRICSTFSFVNSNWLRSGEGEMFNKPVPIPEERLREYESSLDPETMAFLEEENEYDWMRERAAAFDKQSEELKKAYEIISNNSAILANKEEQIIKLSKANRAYKEKIRQLESQLAGLVKDNASD